MSAKLEIEPRATTTGFFTVIHLSGSGSKHPQTRKSMELCVKWASNTIEKMVSDNPKEKACVLFDGDPFREDVCDVAHLARGIKEVLKDRVSLIALVDASCKLTREAYPNVDRFFPASFEHVDGKTLYGGFVDGKPRGITKTVNDLEPSAFFIVGGGKIAAETAVFGRDAALHGGSVVVQAPSALVAYEKPFTEEELEAIACA
ncbi:MAG: hypothetical protein P1U53_11105 [Sulfitobacter sp.]|nr:hypothetical protein [Sulfitobacter sp.]